MFKNLFNACEIVISFFYNFMSISYGDFISFLNGDLAITTVSLINNVPFSIQMPNFGVVDFIVDAIFELITLLFQPLPFLASNIYADTPFYICFLSFFVNSLLAVALYKLVAFIIELIPFE